ncbi:dipeptide ABC transporter ATP-binding protein [Paenibacillus sp. Lou8.1]|uniref:ABC transporter ATP-binding protein n=1 Tax=Paenibacillus sp. Lou8.1 TaxID=2962041 RepID=UPI0020B68CE4|nr:dipeptide ABC transporter ATP-binding protein [Paenibacillus sp. Lou8.1]MCP3806304.1 dipeptide ABC transporter ATP-binding protein [Paenibacillus sp. Lou8.1]
MSSLLEIEHLSVDFHTKKGLLQALDNVSLTIGAGETVCLVGESGSGKTITSKAIMRLIDYENGRIAQGQIRLQGIDLTVLSQQELRSLRGKKMAMVFQEPMSAFDPVYTIGYQLIEIIMEHDRKTRKQAWTHAVHLLNRVGIPEPEIRMKQYPGELSGGMLQRAMIAMALSCGPELLIADEPTTALDVTIQSQILQLLQELKAEFNMSILLITHDLGIAAEVADRIVVMYAGRVVEQAATEELFELPLHPYTRGLLGSVATLDTDRSSKLFSIPGAIPSLSALPSGCLFHPRCPHATDHCKNEAPPLAAKDEREVACWHSEQLATSGDWRITELSVKGQITADAVAKATEVKEEVTNVSAVDGAKVSIYGIQVKNSPESNETITESVQNKQDLFRVDGLRKYYPVKKGFPGRIGASIRAVDDVSFLIRKGETFGLVGESGSGKSTLGRMLMQLERPTSGQVWFQNQELTRLGNSELRSVRRDMQMIFQDPYGSLDPRWSVGDIIGEPLAVHEGLNGKAKQERVEELLSAVGLSPSLVTRFPHEFSGGQRQRIGIARAIALQPQFILADEAVSALDVSVQAQIVNLLQDLQRKLDTTYLFIAHGLHIVRHISDRIGVMYLGKLVEIAPSDELFRHPAHPYTRGLVASIPNPNPKNRRELITIQGEIPSPAKPPSGCRFHTRCPLATSRCREEVPELTAISTGHYAACHYPS